MPDQEHARPVWLTRDQRDRLAWRNDPIADLWDAAPADATEAVREAISTALRVGRSTTDATLRALGNPDV